MPFCDILLWYQGSSLLGLNSRRIGHPCFMLRASVHRVILQNSPSVVWKTSSILVARLPNLVLLLLVLLQEIRLLSNIILSVVEVVDTSFHRLVWLLVSALSLAWVLSETQGHVFADIRSNISRNRVVVVAYLTKLIHLVQLSRFTFFVAWTIAIALFISWNSAKLLVLWFCLILELPSRRLR